MHLPRTTVGSTARFTRAAREKKVFLRVDLSPFHAILAGTSYDRTVYLGRVRSFFSFQSPRSRNHNICQQNFYCLYCSAFPFSPISPLDLTQHVAANKPILFTSVKGLIPKSTINHLIAVAFPIAPPRSTKSPWLKQSNKIVVPVKLSIGNNYYFRP